MTTQSWSDAVVSWLHDTFIGEPPALERQHAEKLEGLVGEEVEVLQNMEQTLDQAIDEHYQRFVNMKEKLENLLSERECLIMDILDVDAAKQNASFMSYTNAWSDVHCNIDPIVNESIHRLSTTIKKIYRLEKQRLKVKRHIKECQDYEEKVESTQRNTTHNTHLDDV